jgi:hypothetical protein
LAKNENELLPHILLQVLEREKVHANKKGAPLSDCIVDVGERNRFARYCSAVKDLQVNSKRTHYLKLEATDKIPQQIHRELESAKRKQLRLLETTEKGTEAIHSG